MTWGELVKWVKNPNTRKECGNYLLGTLRPTDDEHNGVPCADKLHRNKDALVSRSAITLDADSATPGLVDRAEALGCLGLAHSTYSSTLAEPRLRLILPTNRDLTPDEYRRAARALMELLGADEFDPTCEQPERYMFKPGTADQATYQHWTWDGPPLDVDALLARAPQPAPAAPESNPTPPAPTASPEYVGAVVAGALAGCDSLKWPRFESV